MFGLFKKKEMDLSSAKSFWDWYVENDEKLIEKLQAHESDIIEIIDAHLSPVFPYCNCIEFQLGGYIDGKYELYFFYCGNRNLKRDAETLKNMMPSELSDHITFNIEK